MEVYVQTVENSFAIKAGRRTLEEWRIFLNWFLTQKVDVYHRIATSISLDTFLKFKNFADMNNWIIKIQDFEVEIPEKDYCIIRYKDEEILSVTGVFSPREQAIEFIKNSHLNQEDCEIVEITLIPEE